ncbi:MAG: flagellar biosynthetic protein FliQ [bacterium]
MTLDLVTSIINSTVQIIILASLPTVGMGLAVGLLIGLLQALTQIQEQTLTFVPKMIVVFLILGATFSWMFTIIMDMALGLWGNIPYFSK